jgi:hypothetical protein
MILVEVEKCLVDGVIVFFGDEKGGGLELILMNLSCVFCFIYAYIVAKMMSIIFVRLLSFENVFVEIRISLDLALTWVWKYFSLEVVPKLFFSGKGGLFQNRLNLGRRDNPQSLDT